MPCQRSLAFQPYQLRKGNPASLGKGAPTPPTLYTGLQPLPTLMMGTMRNCARDLPKPPLISAGLSFPTEHYILKNSNPNQKVNVKPSGAGAKGTAAMPLSPQGASAPSTEPPVLAPQKPPSPMKTKTLWWVLAALQSQ